MEAGSFLGKNAAYLILAFFSILWIILGYLWGRGKGKTTSQYLFAGRMVGLSLSIMTLMASWVTGNTTMSAPEMSYNLGVWGFVGYSGAAFGLIFFAPLAIRIKKLLPEGLTSGDFIRI
jgi:Na+/proline symporter